MILIVNRFRWAFCQMETLEECMTLDEIEDALDDLPATLDETYERILRDIWKTDAKKAHNILTWLLFSKGPLSLWEVADAAVVRPGDNPLSPRSRLQDPTLVLRICRSLITKSEETLWHKYGDQFKMIPIVRFAHFSVKEYLVSGRSKLFTGQPMPSRLHIGDCCISMLLLIENVRIQDLDVHFRKNNLLRYAASSWFLHIQELEEGDPLPAELSARVYQLLDRGPGSANSHTWTTLYDPVMGRYARQLESKDFELLPLTTLPPLSFSGCLGLVGATHHFIKAGSVVDESINVYSTALELASERGHYKVVELLLQSGANVKPDTSEAQEALIYAISSKHDGVVRLLLEHGADAKRALHAAVRLGYESMVRLALHYGANANEAIYVAVRRGHEAVVRVLLEHGANANYPNSLLYAVIRGGNVQIAEMLLRKGAELDAEICTRALHNAAEHGHSDLFQWFFERGACITTAGGDRRSIHLAAIRVGHLNILLTLMRLGVDICAPGYVKGPEWVGYQRWYNSGRLGYTTALQYASYMGHYGIVEWLLNNGAEVDKPDVTLGTALQAATRARFRVGSEMPVKLDIIRLLLKHKAEVNKQMDTKLIEIPFRSNPERKGNALQQAVASRHVELVQLLAESGAEINAKHDECGTALMCASRENKIRDMLQVLVSEGADVNAQVDGIGSALSEAARWGRWENAQFLVDNGADVNAYVGGIGTALSIAVQNRQIEAAVDLIEHGGDLRAAIEAIGNSFSLTTETECGDIAAFCLASFACPWDEERDRTRIVRSCS